MKKRDEKIIKSYAKVAQCITSCETKKQLSTCHKLIALFVDCNWMPVTFSTYIKNIELDYRAKELLSHLKRKQLTLNQ